MEIMNGGYFPFVCKKYIFVTKNRCSDMETDSLNNVIKNDISNSIDTKLETINSNMNTLLLNTTTYKIYSEAITHSLDTISLGINHISDSVVKLYNESYDKFILSLLNINKNNNNNNHNNRYTNSRYVQNNSVSNINTQIND